MPETSEKQRRDGAPPAGLSRAARRALSYSTLVGRLKLALPAAALLLAGSVILWPLLQERAEKLIPVGDLKIRADGLEMAAPHLSGLDDTGKPYKISAESGTSDGFQPTLVTLTKPVAQFAYGDQPVTVTAATGFYHPKNRTVGLTGTVRVVTGDGYTAKTDRIEIDLAKGTATSDKPVTAKGPDGRIEANGFTAAEGGHVLTFRGDVKVVIAPQAIRPAPKPTSPEAPPPAKGTVKGEP